jgi:hypothetical protein
MEMMNRLTFKEKGTPLSIPEVIRDEIFSSDFQISKEFINKYSKFVNDNFDKLSKITLQRLALYNFPFSTSAQKYVHRLLRKNIT